MICHQGVSEAAGAKAERFVPESGGGCRAASLTRSSRRARSHEGSWIRRKGAEDVVQYRGRTDGLSSKSKRRKWHGEGCLESEFSLNCA